MATSKSNIKLINRVLKRGVAEIVDQKSLTAKLKSGKKLRVKLGIDPTGPKIHLGRSIPLLKLKDFQVLGHQIVLIVGDFTGQIGDTSDKESERPMLSEEQVKKNMTTYLDQMGLILDLTKVEVHYNSEWLAKLTLAEVSQLADAFSVHDFTEREVIKRRMTVGKRVNMREMLYPLMQGYDSIAVKADVEVGGTDQRFNLLAGRTLMKQQNLVPQDIIMGELINGTDGKKMSTSAGNTIFLTSTAKEMFGAMMSIQDDLIIPYLNLITRVPEEEVTMWVKRLAKGENPKNAKLALAKVMVEFYHSQKEAQVEEREFVKVFSKKEQPSTIKLAKVKAGDKSLATLLAEIGLASSKSEAERLIKQGGVRVDQAPITDPQASLTVRAGMIINVGKRNWVKLQLQR